MSTRPVPLVLALSGTALVGTVGAQPKLGEALPAHPWRDAPLELVVVYSHDCGDMGGLWKDVLAGGLPVLAVNAENVPAAAPPGMNVWRGDGATAFSRAVKVGVYPSILLVQGGRVLNLWEGTFDLQTLRDLL